MSNKFLVLLADDDPDDAEAFAEVLGEIDPTIAFCHVKDGTAVVDYFKQPDCRAPRVIFLDINMPKMDGWACLSYLRSDEATKHLPVLIYTTSSHHRDRQIAADLGATGFLTKPTRYAELTAMLKIVMDNLDGDLHSALKIFQ